MIFAFFLICMNQVYLYRSQYNAIFKILNTYGMNKLVYQSYCIFILFIKWNTKYYSFYKKIIEILEETNKMHHASFRNSTSLFIIIQPNLPRYFLK